MTRLLKRKLWDLRLFDAINLPENLGLLPDPERFSESHAIRVLDLPLHMPGQGWRIPEQLDQFTSFLEITKKSELRYGSLDDFYCYITVDQRFVEVGKSQRRPGAHSDSYIEKHGIQVDVTAENHDALLDEFGETSHTYVCYDTLPTEFFNAKFPIDEPSCDSSLAAFDAIAKNAAKVIYPNYTVLRLDPYVVHQAAVAKESTDRTFAKISYSTKKYNRKENTVNTLFNYSWDMVPRSTIRNHPYVESL